MIYYQNCRIYGAYTSLLGYVDKVFDDISLASCQSVQNTDTMRTFKPNFKLRIAGLAGLLSSYDTT